MARRVLGPCFLIVALALAVSSQAHADQMDNFKYTFGGNTYTWQLPSAQTPSSVTPGESFEDDNVPITLNNMNPPTLETLDFFLGGGIGGGFLLKDGSGVTAITFGPQLFSLGTSGLSDPVFSTGMFTLNNGSSSGPTGTLMISPAPEPGTLLLLGAGLLGLAAAAKRSMRAVA